MEKPTITQLITASVAVIGLSMTIFGTVLANANRITILEQNVQSLREQLIDERTDRNNFESTYRAEHPNEYRHIPKK